VERVGEDHYWHPSLREMLKRIETMASFKQSFSEFIFATNTDGSGKAASFVRALDMRGRGLAVIAHQRKDDAE
jgi:hypothetical protein